MKDGYNSKGRRLRLVPLILGSYGIFLGLGLTIIGLAKIEEGIGIIRVLLGLGMVCFGLFGIWDGIRDLVRPDKKPENAPATQYILTDRSGNKSSHVTMERLQEQLSGFTEKDIGAKIELQILPPVSIRERGLLKKVSCVQQEAIRLTAFFEGDRGGYRIYREAAGPDAAEEWFRQFLSGNMDFSGWEKTETDACQGEVTRVWHQLLIIFGESWRDEHKFFSARDLELAAEGVYNGTYQKAVLEWGAEVIHLFSGSEEKLTVIWRTDPAGGGIFRFFAKEGTITQVKFWLTCYLEKGSFEETSGWVDITAQLEKEWRKHRNVF
ncbi:MAG: hypothetical protein HFE83_12250 [Lachnospiraceae bacterium]|jgi:hypothetical protein|nr:hypothetical protein [Lachnospiraceae bacterium]